jgi:inorganic pyrophosphatase
MFKFRERKSLLYLHRQITIYLDRPMGSRHPKYGFIYPVNYGYLPGVISGDGEELDAYLLGVFHPVIQYTGMCIAVIHRYDDDDDKLIVVPRGVSYTPEQILALTEFQERYFDAEVITRSRSNVLLRRAINWLAKTIFPEPA